jgi:ketosteroid isomerase-like protein
MYEAIWRATLLAGLLLGGSWAPTVAPAAESQRAGLEAAIHRWMTAVNEQDEVTLATAMTEDVEILDSAATVTGRAAVIRALREVGARGQLVATSREITIAHCVAWHVVGLAQTQKNGDVQARGQALEIWKRMNGHWKLHRRITAEAISPGVSVTRPSTDEPVLDRPKKK